MNIFDKGVNIIRKSRCFRQKKLGGQQGPPCLCAYKFHVFPFETAAVADGDKVFGHGVVFFSGVDGNGVEQHPVDPVACCFGCKLPETLGRCVCRDGLMPVLDAIRTAQDNGHHINDNTSGHNVASFFR